jgi:hypothetical protein
MVGTLLVADSQPFQVDNITNSDCYTDPTADLDSQHQEWLAFEVKIELPSPDLEHCMRCPLISALRESLGCPFNRRTPL